MVISVETSSVSVGSLVLNVPTNYSAIYVPLARKEVLNKQNEIGYLTKKKMLLNLCLSFSSFFM